MYHNDCNNPICMKCNNTLLAMWYVTGQKVIARVVPNESGPSGTLFGNLPAEYKIYIAPLTHEYCISSMTRFLVYYCTVFC